MTLQPVADRDGAPPDRIPLRLLMGGRAGRDRLDGGWWPQSRDLVVELADLVDHFPAQLGRIVRARYSAQDWDTAPRRVVVRAGSVDVAPSPEESHLIALTTATRATLFVLVIPPSFSEAQGTEALLAAATARNTHSATDLLDAVTEQPDVNPADLWTDESRN